MSSITSSLSPSEDPGRIWRIILPYYPPSPNLQYFTRRRTYDDGLEETLGNGEPVVRALAPRLSLLLDKLPVYCFDYNHAGQIACVFYYQNDIYSYRLYSYQNHAGQVGCVSDWNQTRAYYWSQTPPISSDFALISFVGNGNLDFASWTGIRFLNTGPGQQFLYRCWRREEICEMKRKMV